MWLLPEPLLSLPVFLCWSGPSGVRWRASPRRRLYSTRPGSLWASCSTPSGTYRCEPTPAARIEKTSKNLKCSAHKTRFVFLFFPCLFLQQLPVITSNTIVRCRSCRTYINPFVTFLDQRRWKCNLCYRVNDGRGRMFNASSPIFNITLYSA